MILFSYRCRVEDKGDGNNDQAPSDGNEAEGAEYTDITTTDDDYVNTVHHDYVNINSQSVNHDYVNTAYHDYEDVNSVNHDYVNSPIENGPPPSSNANSTYTQLQIVQE